MCERPGTSDDRDLAQDKVSLRHQEAVATRAPAAVRTIKWPNVGLSASVNADRRLCGAPARSGVLRAEVTGQKTRKRQQRA